MANTAYHLIPAFIFTLHLVGTLIKSSLKSRYAAALRRQISAVLLRISFTWQIFWDTWDVDEETGDANLYVISITVVGEAIRSDY